MCAQLQETPIELQKLRGQLVRKEMPVGDNSCYLSHNCPSIEITSLAMASHPRFCLQSSMHLNNENSLVKFVGRMHFGFKLKQNL